MVYGVDSARTIHVIGGNGHHVVFALTRGRIPRSVFPLSPSPSSRLVFPTLSLLGLAASGVRVPANASRSSAALDRGSQRRLELTRRS